MRLGFGIPVIGPAVGGVLIGFAAVLLMLSIGRIAGISGIFAGCLDPTTSDKGWRLTFVTGLIAAPLLGGAPVVAVRGA